MQEMIPGIVIETGYLGVTLGAINLPHGLLLIDAPLRQEDTRSWRTSLLNLGGGVDRLLVNLDAHPDRTMNVRAMECTVVGHEKMAQVIRVRPTAFKSQTTETGAEWEEMPNLGAIRWNPPEICFTGTLTIHWGDTPVILEHHPGPSSGSTWVHLPIQKTIFVGDALIYNQPPFLSFSSIPEWIESLKVLLTPLFRDYFIIGGRNGILPQDEVRRQIGYLQHIHELLLPYSNEKSLGSGLEAMITELLSPFKVPAELKTRYSTRLRWGLNNYHLRHSKINHPAPEE